MLTCQSCGMPMDRAEDHGAAKPDNPYCKYCTDEQGNLLPREAVRQKMIDFFVKTMGKSAEEGAQEVDRVMARMPAWQEGSALPQATTTMDITDTKSTPPMGGGTTSSGTVPGPASGQPVTPPAPPADLTTPPAPKPVTEPAMPGPASEPEPTVPGQTTGPIAPVSAPKPEPATPPLGGTPPSPVQPEEKPTI